MILDNDTIKTVRRYYYAIIKGVTGLTEELDVDDLIKLGRILNESGIIDVGSKIYDKKMEERESLVEVSDTP